MISSIRNMFSSKLGVGLALAFLGLMAVAFSLSDINNLAGGPSGATLAKVGDQTITDRDLARTMKIEFDKAREQIPTLTMNEFAQDGGFDRVLTTMIDQAALHQYATDTGFRTSKRVIDAQIIEQPAFTGLNGAFDRNKMVELLGQQGMTERDFRESLYRQGLFEQLSTAIGVPPRVPASLVEPYAALQLERRFGQAVFIPADALAPAAAPDEKVLAQYIKDNAARYRTPEQRAIRYATFDLSSVPAPTITDADIKKVYDENAARFASQQSRSFTQVIAPDEATARKIAAGGDLSAAAKAAGLATASVSFNSEKDMAAAVGANVAKAGFAAASGATVGPIQGSLGWTVAKLDTVNSTAGKSLAQATPEIRAQLVKARQQESLVDLYNAVQDAANSGASAAEIATKNKLTLVTTPPLTANGAAPSQPGYTPSADLKLLLPTVMQGAGEGDAQLASLIENERFAIYDIARVVPAAVPAIDTIRAKAVADWKRAEGAKAARERARTILRSVESGKSLADAAAAAGPRSGSVQRIGGSRMALRNAEGRVPPELALLFSMPQGSAKTLELGNNNGWMVLKLDTIERAPKGAIPPAALQGLAQQFGPALSNEWLGQLVAAARARVGVKRNEAGIAAQRAAFVGSPTDTN